MKNRTLVKRGSPTDHKGSVTLGFRPSHKEKFCCPHCRNWAYLTNEGRWFTHRMPPKNYGYNMPNRAGPVCKMSGRAARQSKQEENAK
jgi:hypothetical protein